MPDAMVTPDRLIPAKRARIWVQPTAMPRKSGNESSRRKLVASSSLAAAVVAAPLVWRPRGALSRPALASERRRSTSAPSRITPLMVKKIAAESGLANWVRSLCSKARPTIPTGMVARMISQIRRWRGSAIDRSRTEVVRPPARFHQVRR